LLTACLGVRNRHRSAVGPRGDYQPLEVEGPGADRVLAFARGREVVLAVSRWPMQEAPDHTTIDLPEGTWTNVLTGDVHRGRVTYGALRDGAPLVVLETDFDPVR